MSSSSPQQNPPPRRIRQLPRQLANQIAAGEVIERPASVVKELVENSIDAGSSQIDIVIERGGIQLIQVSDNGHGIAVEDLPLALSPHATSKIYTLEELNQILSLGFRGEALASIASISRITLQSRQAGDAMGWMVNEAQPESNHQPSQSPKPCAIPEGSRIAVRELFFNTPGRKRFLRTERTEFLQIESMVRRLALSHFEIGFSLEHNGKSILRLPATGNDEQRLQRVGVLFGKPFVGAAMQIRFEAGDMVLSGWMGAPGFSIAQSDRQYFYLNGRGMKDKVISHAIRHVYQGEIPEGRHPAYLLNLEIDPGQIDVNVHPTKHEVRFRQGRMVHDFITTSLLRAFEEGEVAPLANSSQIDIETGEIYASQEMYHQHLPRMAEAEVGYRKNAREGRQKETLFGTSGAEQCTLIARKYLLFIVAGEHYLSDLLSLYHRVVDEAFEKLASGAVKQLRGQALLFPETINLPVDILDSIEAKVEESVEQLSPFGISLKRQGSDTLLLHTLPQLLDGADYREFVKSLFEQWGATELPQFPRLLNRLIKEYGSKAVVDPAEYSAPSSSWLKRFSIKGLSQLVAARETMRLDGSALVRLFE